MFSYSETEWAAIEEPVIAVSSFFLSKRSGDYMKQEDNRTVDLIMAMQSLDGRKLVLERKPGATYQRPEEGLGKMRRLSAGETSAGYAAIARLLLSTDPPAVLLRGLAGVFAPDGHEAAGSQKAKLKSRKRNRREDDVRAAHVIAEVEFLRHHKGLKLEDAVAEVASKHGIEEGRVRSIRTRHPEIVAAVKGSFDPQK